MPTPQHAILIDTDIGDDIDDALALGLAVCSPELDLVGVTTVFGDVETRTRLALRVLAAFGREDIPVATGQGDRSGAIRDTALAYGLMSKYTAFVAVDSSRRTAGAHGTTVNVPVPVPDGVRYDTTVSE